MSEPHNGQSCKTHTLYHMDCAEFDALRLRAAGCCEICGIPAEETPARGLVIDHDHRYGMGAVRGMLCNRCNTKLGVAEGRQNSVMLLEQDRLLAPYLRNAWHMQIVRWARTHDGLMGSPDVDQQSFNDAVIRFSTVAQMIKLTGRRPTITTRTIIRPGSARTSISAIYEIDRGECGVHLWHAAGLQFLVDHIHVVEHRRPSSHARYRSLTEARSHLVGLMS